MIWDNGGDDVINSGTGDDWMIAGRGADEYRGGGGFDVLAYVRADTGVRVDMNNSNGTALFRETSAASFAFGDTMAEIEGVVGSRHGDTIRGFFDSPSYINGFEGDDRITGSRSADVLKGGRDNDTISGLGGGDQMFGGHGNDGFTIGGDDVISGGIGIDSFVFLMPKFLETGDGVSMGDVVITDFDVGGQQDRLIFQGLTGGELNVVSDGRDIVITVDGADGSIRLLNTDFQELAGSITI